MIESAPMFKIKRRSAHGFFSSPQTQPPTISSPTDFVKLSGMGSVGEAPGTSTPARSSVNSAMTPARGSANAIKSDDRIGDSGAVGEPLVQDYEQVQPEHEYDANTLQEAAQTSPARSSTTSTLLRPHGGHPVTFSSDEDTAAPPPPDFTRRGIHIPMRTR